VSNIGVTTAGQHENISIDDGALIRQCQLGDLKATEGLIIRYQDRVFNVIMKIVGNRDDAAELTQETFVKVIEKIGTFKAQSSFYTWLFRVAVNTALNFCRKRFRVTTQSLDAVVAGDGESSRKLGDFLVDKSEIGPVEIAQKKETARLITAALGKLSENHRVVIILRDIEGMSYGEVSTTLALELGTVRSRISRARSEMRKILEATLK
jgi:RNA polymerase sigma-70 factor (ECF subfamily)